MPPEPAVVVGVCLDPTPVTPDPSDTSDTADASDRCRVARDLQQALTGAQPHLAWSVWPVSAVREDPSTDDSPTDAGAMLADGRKVLWW